MHDRYGECEQEKHLRDKFRMQQTEGAIAEQAVSSGTDVTRKQAEGAVSSAATKRISSEEIQSLDRSPQRGAAAVRGRLQGNYNTAAKTTSPSHMNVSVENSRGSTQVHSKSQKLLHSQTTVHSPGNSSVNDGVVSADTAVISREAKSQHVPLPQSGSRRPSGHVSDNSSRHDRMKNSHHSQRATFGACRGGYVSDTSFTASAATESVRTAVEGI